MDILAITGKSATESAMNYIADSESKNISPIGGTLFIGFRKIDINQELIAIYMRRNKRKFNKVITKEES